MTHFPSFLLFENYIIVFHFHICCIRNSELAHFFQNFEDFFFYGIVAYIVSDAKSGLI